MPEKDKDGIIADLRLQISMLKTVLRKMPGNIYWKSLDDRLLGCNDNCAKIVGASSPDELIGKKSEEYLPEDVAKKTKQIDLDVIESEKEATFEEVYQNEGKTTTWVSRKSPFYDSKGKLIGTIGISVDITEQKKVQEKLKVAKKKAEDANRAKSQFLALMSHELRIPLTSIIGFANFLKEEKTTKEERQLYLRNLSYSSNYLYALINKILDYSKLEANKFKIVEERTNLKILVDNVKGMLASIADEKALQFIVKCDPTIPEYVLADPSALQQVLINLVGNAIKFTKKGKVILQLKCLEKSVDSVKVEINIHDTGVGIPSNQIKYIFKEFYQVNDIYTRDESITGTGLGLSIVQKLIKLMNAKMKVSSKLNQGTCFTIVVNFPIPKKSIASILKLADTDKPAKDSGGRVLLVEDDALVQFVHTKMLNKLGYEVVVAQDGKSALELYSNDYVVIFVDLGLPDMNGFDLIKAIREKARTTSSCVPIVGLTGFFSEDVKKDCLSAGADQVIVKPVSQKLLGEIILKYKSVLS